MDFIDVVNEAKKAEAIIESMPNNTVMSNEMIDIAKEALLQNFSDFTCYLTYIVGIDSAYRTCYFSIAKYIYNKAIAKYGGNWKVSVGELSNYICWWGQNEKVFAFRFKNLNFNILKVS